MKLLTQKEAEAKVVKKKLQSIGLQMLADYINKQIELGKGQGETKVTLTDADLELLSDFEYQWHYDSHSKLLKIAWCEKDKQELDGED